MQGQRWGQTSNVAVNVNGGVDVIVEDNVKPSELASAALETSSPPIGPPGASAGTASLTWTLTWTLRAPGEAWSERKACSSPKFRRATRGENPTGDDGDRHAGSESCEIVRKYTGDRDLEA